MTGMSAEERYRDAFERLKLGRAKNVPTCTIVSLASVAREAGSEPSALKRSRYPLLAEEILDWSIRSRKSTVGCETKLSASRKKIQRLEAKLREVQEQRDRAVNLLLAAEQKLLARLRTEGDCASCTTVVQFPRPKGV